MDSFKEANPNCEFSKVQTWSKIRWDSVSSSNGNIGKTNISGNPRPYIRQSIGLVGKIKSRCLNLSLRCVSQAAGQHRGLSVTESVGTELGVDWTDLTLARHVSSQCPPSLLTIPACLTISTMSTWA